MVGGYTGVVCDLDGVVRRGDHALPYAIDELRGLTVPVIYATNNASLTPQDVATQLTGLGLDVTASGVVTSSQAGAAYVASLVPPGSRVLAVGGPGVAAALAERGLRPVLRASEDVVAVLQGYGPLVTASDLAEASYAVGRGATWVATNRDTTLPTDRGVAPGNGALVAAVALATGVQPTAVGKPEPPLYQLAAERLGSGTVLAIGDRLDTDILGAAAAGLDSLWVLTGVDDLESFALSPERPTPTHVGLDLRVLSQPLYVVDRDERRTNTWVCRSQRLRVDWREGTVHLAAPPGAQQSTEALLASAVAALVHARDEQRRPPDDLARVAAAVTARLALSGPSA